MRKTFFTCIVFFAFFGSLLTGETFPQTPPNVSLELTYPAGVSPRVFTTGWVFGAKAILNPGTPNAQDISDQVQWSGSGTFVPKTGGINHPYFPNAGKNTITLTVNVDGEQIQKSYTVDTISPYNAAGERLYAVLSDLAFCPSDSHGCYSCPHAVKGPIIKGSPNVMLKFHRDIKDDEPPLPVARVGDPGIHAACCGSNTYEIVEGDPNVLIDGKPAARIGDKTQHCGGVGKIVGTPEKKYYVIFQLHMPQVKEEKKPKRREGESNEEWSRRRKAAYQNLTYTDFIFKDEPLEKTPFIMGVAEEALKKYLEQEFVPGSQWSMKINISSKMDGTVLLICHGTYNTKEDLFAAYPFLAEQEKKKNKDSKEFYFTNAEGTGTLQMDKETVTAGPLIPKWTEQNKHEAVDFVKSFLALFDCFITHTVYENTHIDRIELFREFRDKILTKSDAGRHLIRLYYEYGPFLAMELRQRPLLIPVFRAVFDMLAMGIERLDLKDPGLTMKFYRPVQLTDRIVSIFYKEGHSSGLGQFSRTIVPLLWE